MNGTDTTRSRHLRRAASAGETILVVMGVAWAIFSRPAPVVNVEWRQGVSEQARLADETALQLTHREPADDPLHFHYELMTPDSKGISAIVDHPDVRDTAHIVRSDARIADDAGVGPDRVWWWGGPFRGRGGDHQFRILFGVIVVMTAACEWAVRRAR
jgi:hypothetical protein